MNSLLTRRNVTIWVTGCFVLASLYAALNVSITDKMAAARLQAHQRADAEAKAHARALVWEAHQKRLAWQRAHPEEYARQQAAVRAAARQRELAAENERRAAEAKQQEEANARAAVQEQKEAEEANLFHGDPDCLVLDKRSLTTESGDYTWYIEGKVINTCDRDFGYAQVEFNFYDSSGNQVASGLVNINNLAAGQTWSFKKSVYETETSRSWRVAGLSAF